MNIHCLFISVYLYNEVLFGTNRTQHTLKYDTRSGTLPGREAGTVLKYDTWAGTVPGRNVAEAGTVAPSPADTEV